MNCSLNFSYEDDEKLVAFVAQNPPIYDSKLESYKYAVIRDSLWRDIANAMNKSSDDCKKRWKYIKDSYNRYKRKKKAGTGSQTKTSKWEFYERLNFLEDGVTNAPSPSESQSSATYNDVPESDIDIKIEFAESTSLAEECDQSEQLQENTGTGQISHSKKRKRQQDEFLENMKKWDNQRQMLFKDFSGVKMERNTDQDDLFSFGEHIKSVLKKLPPILRISAKTELFSVLTKYELMSLETPNPTPSTSSFSSAVYMNEQICRDPLEL